MRKRFLGAVCLLAFGIFFFLAGGYTTSGAGLTVTYDGNWGGQGSSNGKLNEPFGIVMDQVGQLYVSDKNGIQVFDIKGTFVRKILASSSPFTTMHYGMAFDKDGNLWVAYFEGNQHGLKKLAPDGTLIARIGTYGNGNGQFSAPGGLAFTPEGNIWVVDTNNNRMEKIDPQGNFLTAIGTPGAFMSPNPGDFAVPKGIAMNPDGTFFVVEQMNNRVQKFDAAGKYLSQFGGRGNGDGQFQGPMGITVDWLGRIWVSDTANARIQAFDTSGKFLAKYGTRGNGADQLMWPIGILVTSDGLIFVADSYSHRILRLKIAG